MKWTKEPPKVDGWYWAILGDEKDDDQELVEVLGFQGGWNPPVAWLANRRHLLGDFRAWSDAPIPLPDGEVPE